ncbi:MAG: hypothetical protein RIE73_20035 [Coleofasciculus sp. C1-SOL-03]
MSSLTTQEAATRLGVTVLHVAPMGTQRLAYELLGRLVVRSRYDIADLIGNKSGIVDELREVAKKL